MTGLAHEVHEKRARPRDATGNTLVKAAPHGQVFRRHDVVRLPVRALTEARYIFRPRVAPLPGEDIGELKVVLHPRILQDVAM